MYKNITQLLRDFDFVSQDNIKECLKRFYETNPQVIHRYSENLNIDILMETGTGKTFTYLNLMFELCREYDSKKFIIFVPRRAILESVRQNVELTKSYFYSKYGRYLKTYYYTDSKSLSEVWSYVGDREFSLLVLTNSAIDKQANILNQARESAFGKSTFESLIDLKPICIIDEPHLLKGEKFYESFSRLKSLYFRFGATFPKEEKFQISNIAYVLDSIQAFERYLVEQICVHSLENLENDIFLKSCSGKKATFSYNENGVSKEITLGINENLNGKELIKIDSKSSKAYFSDNSVVSKVGNYILGNDERNRLLRRAIELHFEKEEKLFNSNIKALSLFFIPSIDDFRGRNAALKEIFERIYKEIRTEILKKDLNPKYREFLQKDFDNEGKLVVYQGYFSGDAKLSNKNKDSQEGADIALILKDNERLLSLDTPLRFIFSVWALQEGWDNPNIFTIAKLSSSASEISIHQQVGRGLRLALNSSGRRMNHKYFNEDDNAFYEVNALDIVISGKEHNYIERLQKEVQNLSFSNVISYDRLREIGLNDNKIIALLTLLNDNKIISFNESQNQYIITESIHDFISTNKKAQEILGDKLDEVLKKFPPSTTSNRHEQIKKGNDIRQVRLRQDLAARFKELRDSINYEAKIIYKHINEEILIDSIKQRFQNEVIEQKEIIFRTKTLEKNIIKDEKITKLDSKHYSHALEYEEQNALYKICQNLKFPYPFIYKIYERLDKSSFRNSPKDAFSMLERVILDSFHENLVQMVDYEFTCDVFSHAYSNLVENGKIKEKIPMHLLGRESSVDKVAESYLYDSLVYDSLIEKDLIKQNISEFESKEGKISIKVFAKLPRLSIPTPYKNYEPDFAYFIEEENGGKIFFVCETKGYDSHELIPAQERRKIDYAKVFFAKLHDKLKDKNIKVLFNVKTNKEELYQVIQKTLKGQQ